MDKSDILYQAAENNDLNTIKKYIEQNEDQPSDADTRHRTATTIFRIALRHDYNEITEYMLNHGNFEAGTYTCFLGDSIALDSFNTEIAGFLLALGANPTEALIHTYYRDNDQAFDYLIEHGADINEAGYLEAAFNDLEDKNLYDLDKILALGADPFILVDFTAICANNRYPFFTIDRQTTPNNIPLLHYYMNIWTYATSLELANIVIETLDHIAMFVPSLNVQDQWGRNLLHYVNTLPLDHNDMNYEGIIYKKQVIQHLIKLGVDPDQPALIDDQEKVTLAKIKGTLPKDYGKTPRQILPANLFTP